MKLTDWIPGDVKPIRPGVYVREFIDVFAFSMWTGVQWQVGASTASEAAKSRKVSSLQDKRWRGLAADPNARR